MSSLDRSLTTRPTVGDRYQLDEIIGRGSSGTIWRAHDLRLDRDVAVKEIVFPPGAGGDKVRARAQREVETAARVNHPSAVALYDAVDDHDRLYLVLELVEAADLGQVVAANGPCAPADVAAMGVGLCDALAAAHAAGIVHRDVSPGNVLLPEGGGPAKLADFGVAAITGNPSITTTGLTVGSPAYMAPEQATGGAVGAATDLWALGATLWFAVEGEPPFARESTMATLHAVVHDEPGPPQRAGPLASLLGDLLSKDPTARPAHAAVRDRLAAIAATPRAGGTAVLPVVRTAVDVPTAVPARPPTRWARQAVALAVLALVLCAVAAAAVLTGGDPTPAGGFGPPGVPRQTTTTIPANPSTTALVPTTPAPTDTTIVPNDDEGRRGRGDRKGGNQGNDDD